MGSWINKLWCSYIKNYYSEIKSQLYNHNMNECQNHYAEWRKENHIFYSTSIKFWKVWNNLEWQKTNQRFPGMWVERGWIIKRANLGLMSMFITLIVVVSWIYLYIYIKVYQSIYMYVCDVFVLKLYLNELGGRRGALKS